MEGNISLILIAIILPLQDYFVKTFFANSNLNYTTYRKSKARHTYTYDNGTELRKGDEILERRIGMTVYRAYSYHSWERGSNENWNGLIRDFFPKGTDFATITDEEVKRVEKNLNNRSRKRLDYLTPHEVFVLGMGLPSAVQV